MSEVTGSFRQLVFHQIHQPFFQFSYRQKMGKQCAIFCNHSLAQSITCQTPDLTKTVAFPRLRMSCVLRNNVSGNIDKVGRS